MRRVPFFFLKSSRVANTAVQDGTVYEFSDFRFIPDDGVLLRDGKPVPLPPKAFATLVVLIESHGHLVKKAELIEKVWSNAFVEEAAVSKCVWTIRNALGEDSKNQQFIQTVPKRGYKFVAPVSIVDDRPAEPQPANGNGSVAPSLTQAGDRSTIDQAANRSLFGKWSTSRIAVAAFVLLGIAIVAAYAIFLRQPAVATATTYSIAVLPLQAVNKAIDDPRYELAIADALILKLSSSKGLAVRSLQAVQVYSDQKKDAVEAGREQNVQYVLSSNYQIAEGKIRVTSQLVNVANGLVEDTFKVEKAMTDFFSAQDAVASDLGNTLLARFAVGPASRTRARGTTNEKAYRNYLQGMYLYDKRRRANSEKALELFQEAVELDPNYAAAWAGKALAHRSISNFVGKDIDTHAEYKKSIDAINTALALDENIADAYTALCENKFLYEWDIDGAERACQRAIELEPNAGPAHRTYSTFLTGQGRHDEAVAEIKIAIDLDPASLFSQRDYGTALYYARRYPEAMTQLKRVVEMDPNYGNIYTWLTATSEAQGNFAEAFSWFMRAERSRRVDESVLQHLNDLYERSGWRGVLRERAEKSADDNRSYSRSACTNVSAGNTDKAFEFLEVAFERREWGIFYLQVEPCFDPIRSDPRFVNLVQRTRVR